MPREPCPRRKDRNLKKSKMCRKLATTQVLVRLLRLLFFSCFYPCFWPYLYKSKSIFNTDRIPISTFVFDDQIKITYPRKQLNSLKIADSVEVYRTIDSDWRRTEERGSIVKLSHPILKFLAPF